MSGPLREGEKKITVLADLDKTVIPSHARVKKSFGFTDFGDLGHSLAREGENCSNQYLRLRPTTDHWLFPCSRG